MTQDATEQQRQIVLRCLLAGQEGELSVRFVEQSHFRLWQYLLANKHNLIVKEAIGCLWLSQADYETNQDLYAHAGQIESVRRVRFAIYDAESGLCDITQRFLPAAEAETVRDLLLKKVPTDVLDSDDLTISEEPGYAILKKTLDLEKIGNRLTR